MIRGKDHMFDLQLSILFVPDGGALVTGGLSSSEGKAGRR